MCCDACCCWHLQVIFITQLGTSSFSCFQLAKLTCSNLFLYMLGGCKQLAHFLCAFVLPCMSFASQPSSAQACEAMLALHSSCKQGGSFALPHAQMMQSLSHSPHLGRAKSVVLPATGLSPSHLRRTMTQTCRHWPANSLHSSDALHQQLLAVTTHVCEVLYT